MSTADKPRPVEGKVRCRVHVSDFPKDWDMSPALWECWLIGKLKEAGVPVKGKLTFRGIEGGTLSRFDDPSDFGATIYEWTPNDAANRTANTEPAGDEKP